MANATPVHKADPKKEDKVADKAPVQKEDAAPEATVEVAGTTKLADGTVRQDF